jgi:hypothetical protein
MISFPWLANSCYLSQLHPNEITRANLPGFEERASVADPVIYSQSGKLPRQLLGSLFNPGASLLCLFHYGSLSG